MQVDTCWESAPQQLRKEVQVGNEGSLEDDGDVGRVEQFDGVRALLTPLPLIFHRDVHTEPLEVDHHRKNEDGCHQVGDVGEVLPNYQSAYSWILCRGEVYLFEWFDVPVKRFLKGTDFVLACDEQMEQGNDGALELGAAASIDGGGAEGLPDNVLADVRGNEQRDT